MMKRVDKNKCLQIMLADIGQDIVHKSYGKERPAAHVGLANKTNMELVTL